MYYKAALLNKVKAHIKAGGLIAYPTESCFGIGCNPFNRKAINRIIKIKKRDKNKGMIVVAGKIGHLDRLIKPLSNNDFEYLNCFWPGHYSFILPTKRNVPVNLTGKHNKIAVRVSSHKLIQQLCSYLAIPLVSTSANKSGFRSIKNNKECLKQFGKSILILPGNIGFAKNPSTIIDLVTKQVIRG